MTRHGVDLAIARGMKSLAYLVATLSLFACVAPMADSDDSDPDFDDGKADAASAIAKGTLGWSGTQDLAFSTASGDPASYIYLTFELSGSADIQIETGPDGSDNQLDTVVYVYQPTGDKWGAYLAKNDDGGDGKYGKLATTLDAGSYRAVVKLKNPKGTPKVAITGTCSGAGCTPPLRGCTTLAPRTSTPELFVGPTQWRESIEGAIDSASTSLDVQMYLFTVTDIADHIISAQQRGVAVRVLLDPHEPNSVVQAKLTKAGVPNHTDPTYFSFAHAKYMIIDKVTAVILSGNFNAAAVNTTDSTGERNYGFVDHDLDDVVDLQAIYESDWAAGPEPDLSCTRLIVSPINSAQRVVDHINTAMHTLDIEVLYLDDTEVRAAIYAAVGRGVAVRVMLSDPARNPQNTTTQTTFQGKGIPTRILTTNYLHTKMIQADGVAMVGSENMSLTSLTKNREVGALIFETEPANLVHTQYEADWASAQ
jgi:HKD family nuclease